MADRYLIIRSTDNMVMFVEEQAPVVRENEVILPDRNIASLNTNNCNIEVIDETLVPSNFQPGIFTYITGTWTLVGEEPVIEPKPVTFYLHHSKPKALIKNDGVDSISFTMQIRRTKNPASAIVAGVTGARGIWPLVWKNGNIVQDIFMVQFTDGVATFDLIDIGAPARLSLSEQDLPIFTVNDKVYRFRLAEPVVFDIYREL